MNRYILILLCLPFLQLGISFYISFQILLVLILASIVIPQKRMADVAWMSLVVITAFLLKYLVAPDIFSMSDLLVTLREILCCWFIVLACQSSFSSTRSIKVFNKIMVYFFVLSAIVVCVQFFVIQWWEGYVGFPQQWFITNQATLKGFDRKLYYGSTLRPTGYYGEPSYMAFMTSALFFAYISVNNVCREAAMTITSYEKSITLLTAVIVILLQSLAGILVFVSLLLLINNKNLKSFWILILFILVVPYVATDSFSRITSLIEGGGDYSVNARLFVPQLIIEKVIFFEGNYAGIGSQDIILNSAVMELDDIHNAIMYLVLHYGVFSLLILGGLCFYLYKRVGLLMVAFFLFAANFNGDIFSYDKAVVIAIVIISIRTAKKLGDSTKPSFQ